MRTRPSLIALIVLVVAACTLIASRDAVAGTGGVGPSTGSGQASGNVPGNADLTPTRYDRLWERVTPADRRWAHKVSYCETGHDPDAVALNGQYRGAFMFTWDAWKTSPKTPGGDPIDYSYKTQAVVAVALKARDGTRPWPVCG
jgi:hypothetical protein